MATGTPSLVGCCCCCCCSCPLTGSLSIGINDWDNNIIVHVNNSNNNVLKRFGNNLLMNPIKLDPDVVGILVKMAIAL